MRIIKNIFSKKLQFVNKNLVTFRESGEIISYSLTLLISSCILCAGYKNLGKK